MFNFFDLTALEWTDYKDKRGTPYKEANVSYFYHKCPKVYFDPENDTVEVTIRKYPDNYFIAYEVHIYDEYSYFGEGYTRDGDGDGVILYSPEIIRVHKVPHALFENDPNWYMSMIYYRVLNAIEVGYS